MIQHLPVSGGNEPANQLQDELPAIRDGRLYDGWAVDIGNRGIFRDTADPKKSIQLNKLRSQAVCIWLLSGEFFIVHYGASDLDVNFNGNPRLSNISVLQYPQDKHYEFSLTRAAELLSISPSDVAKHLDDLERAFLQKFVEFINKKPDSVFVYYAYGEEYGLGAILRRAKRFDIDADLNRDKNINLYDLVAPYFNNRVPRSSVERIFTRNRILPEDFLPGKQEARAFRDAEFEAISRSTNVKVRMFLYVILMIKNNQLISPHKSLITRIIDWIYEKITAVIKWTYDHPLRKLIAVIVLVLALSTWLWTFLSPVVPRIEEIIRDIF